MRRTVLLLASAALAVLLACGVAWAATLAFAPAKSYPTGDEARAVSAGDLDRDGDRDLVTANSAGNDVSVLVRRPDGTFRPPRNLPAGDRPTAVTISDLDRDRDADFAVANLGDDTVSVFRNRGDGTFSRQRKYPVGNTYPQAIESGDVDRDGDQDLLTANLGGGRQSRPNYAMPGTVTVFENRGDGTFQAARNFVAGEVYEPTGLDRSDLDGDGDLDLAVSLDYTRAGEGGVAVLLNGGDGAFGEPQRYGKPYWASDVLANDLDGDGDNDLAVSDYIDETVTVYLGAGDGTFVYLDSYSNGEGAGDANSITEADFDGDGDLDIATANAGNIGSTFEGVFIRRPRNVSVLENSGDGSLGNPRVIEAGASPEDITRARMNADRKPDLVVANDDSDSVSVLRNVTP